MNIRLFEKKLRNVMAKQNLTLGICCGEGSFGRVYKLYDSTGALYGVVKAALFDDDAVAPIKENVVANQRHSLTKEFMVLSQLSRCTHNVRLKQSGLTSMKAEPRTLPTFWVEKNEAGYFIEEALISLTQADELMHNWIDAYGIAPVIGYLGYSISSALSAAQKKWPGFSHRDIKPSNIFLRLTVATCMNENVFVLGDYGICNTSPDALTASANIRNREDEFRYPDAIPTIESDVYSLGCVLAYYAGMPFNEWKGNKTASDLGDIGRFIEKMLSAEKKNRPTIQECLSMFAGVMDLYKGKISQDEKTCSAAIEAFNVGNPNYSGTPLDRVKAHRYNGISRYLCGDIVAAKAEFEAAADTISRFYLASMEASEGKTNAVVDSLLSLKNALEESKSSAVYDFIIVQLYILGYPLNTNEQATAKTVLMRNNEVFSFM